MTTLAPAPPAPTRHAATPRPSFLRHAGTLAWRGITKTIHSTEALLDVTLQPVIFLLLFVYVFGGAISGSPDAYLQLALPGVLVQTFVFASQRTACRRDTRRPRPLPDHRADQVGARATARVPQHHLAAGRRRRVRPGDGV